MFGIASAIPGTGDLCTVGIAVSLNVDIPGSTLVGAQVDVARIFRDAGVRVVWRRSSRQTERSHAVELALAILPRALPTDRPGELGFAGGSDGRGAAYVFYDRVRDVASGFGVSVQAVLTLALAHELGHLLLPRGSHSPSGIMQGGWDRDALRGLGRGLSFTAAQAELIRARCRTPAPR
jgi:hypothetical protein